MNTPVKPGQPERPRVVITRGSDLPHVAQSIPWLWEPYLAFGALSILDGDPGVGKSLLTIDLAARIGFGNSLPDGSPPPRNPVTGRRFVSTLFVNAEDGVRQTILPRLLAAGGFPDTVAFLGGLGEGGAGALPVRFPYDLPLLEKLLAARPGSLAVLDPMMALLGPEVAANNDQTVREALTPLARIAARTQACILLVRHLTKHGRGRSLYRGAGSIGIVGACRTALLVGRHPDDTERRVLAMTKSNLGQFGPSLGYRVRLAEAQVTNWPLLPGDKHPLTGEVVTEATTYPRTLAAAPVVEWEGVTPVTAEDVCAGKPDDGGCSARVVAWLQKLLADGPVPAVRVEQLAHAEGFGYRTVQHAKARLKVESQRLTVDGVTRWEWSLPLAE